MNEMTLKSSYTSKWVTDKPRRFSKLFGGLLDFSYLRGEGFNEILGATRLAGRPPTCGSRETTSKCSVLGPEILFWTGDDRNRRNYVILLILPFHPLLPAQYSDL